MQCSVNDTYWADRFRVEAARIALYQRRNEAVLALLREPTVSSDAEARIRRPLLLSLALARLGHPREAQKWIARADRDPRSASMRAEIAMARGNLALEQGENGSAARSFNRGFHFARAEGNTLLARQALANGGVAALRAERYEAASNLFTQAADLARATDARLALEKYTGNVGASFYGTGDYPRALASFQAARTQAAALHLVADEVEWQSEAALCELALKRTADARRDFERTLQQAQALESPEEIEQAHVALGSLLRADQPAAALRHANLALAMASARGHRPDTFAAHLLRGSILAEHGDRAAAERELLALAHEPDLSPSLRWRVDDALGNLADEDHDTAGADRWFTQALGTFSQQRRSLKTVDYQLPFRETVDDLLNDYMDHLVASGREWDALHVLNQSRMDAQEGTATALGARRQSTGHEDVALGQRLARASHSALLVYRLGQRHAYLWAIGPGRAGFYRLPDGDALRTLVDRHQAAIMSSRDLMGTSGEPARELYRLLVEPALAVIGTSDRVAIMADSVLAGLNFETLLTPAPRSHFWIEDVAVTNTRSLSQLARAARLEKQRSVTSAEPRLLLMGNARIPGGMYADLPNAGEEMQRVETHFSVAERTVFSGNAATPRAFEGSKPGDYAYVHFVAHAVADGMRPMDSAILLAAAPGDAEGYRLTARMVLTTPMHARLVTLSACYGSGTRSYSGEGMVGLAWAFQHAGSEHVIGALWEVSDMTQPYIMDQLYGELARDVPPDRALRDAKLRVLHQSGVMRKPLYWAPLVLY